MWAWIVVYPSCLSPGVCYRNFLVMSCCRQ